MSDYLDHLTQVASAATEDSLDADALRAAKRLTWLARDDRSRFTDHELTVAILRTYLNRVPNCFTELVAVAQRTAELHVPTQYPNDMQQECRGCRHPWPCPSEAALAALKEKVGEGS